MNRISERFLNQTHDIVHSDSLQSIYESGVDKLYQLQPINSTKHEEIEDTIYILILI